MALAIGAAMNLHRISVCAVFCFTFACSDGVGSVCSDPCGTQDAGVDALTPDGSSTPDANADAPPPPSTPQGLSNLGLWLEASQGVGKFDAAHVAQWQDQSGHGNHVQQGTLTAMPLFVPSAVHGRPGLSFDLATLSTPSATQGFSMAADFLVMLVVRSDLADGISGDLFTATGAASNTKLQLRISPPKLTALALVNGSGTYVDAAKAVFSDKAAHVVGMRRQGGTVDLYVDGSKASVAAQTADLGSKLTLGGGGFKGVITELAIGEGTIDDTTVASLGTYFKTKYATP